MVHAQTIVGAMTGVVAVGGLYALGPTSLITHVIALGVASGVVATIALSNRTENEARNVRRSLDRLVLSVMPDDLVVSAIRTRTVALAASNGLPVIKSWEGTLLDRPAWVWTFHAGENQPAGGMLVMHQEDFAKLVLVADQELDAELRHLFFTPGTEPVEAMWDVLVEEVGVAAAWAFRSQGPTAVGVAKYASIQTRELGAAPKTADGIDVARERVFGHEDLSALVRQPRVRRTLSMVERFGESQIAPSTVKERLIAG